MITPMNNKTIKFSDDKISVLIRNCVVDRDQIKNIKDSYLTLEDVPFGVAKNVLRHTHVDVQICKCKDIWEHVLCGDEESLVKAYNAKAEVETDEEVVEESESVVLTQPEYVWDRDDQETTDTTSDSVEEDDVVGSEENIIDTVEAPKFDENSSVEEDSDDSESESEDESDDEVETEEVTEQTQETSNYNASNNGERVVRRQVNMNNHKKHRH